jgi:hypothetical protein
MPIGHTAPVLLSGVVALVLLTGMALAADPPASRPEPSKELRQKMVTLHEQMAACLRSDKAFADCRTELMKGCQEQIGPDGCPMTGSPLHRSGPSGAKPAITACPPIMTAPAATSPDRLT